jgi:RNA 3'-terminal phosphate cyclase (ATP)
LEGDEVGSTRFVFAPQTPPRSDRYQFDIGTAGATPLVAQTVLVPLLHASGPSEVVITGGTHVPHAPTADYVEHVYIPALRRAGANVQFRYTDAGYYPKGGGRVEMAMEAVPSLLPLDFSERGKLQSLTAYVVTSSLPARVGERGEAAVRQIIKTVGRKVEVERRDRPSRGTGAAVVLVAKCSGGWGGFTGIGERGKPMEKVAEEACQAFMEWWKTGAACDEHLADQLALPMALAKGGSRWTTPCPSEHLRTVLWLTQQFLPIEYTLEGPPDGTSTVTLRSVG